MSEKIKVTKEFLVKLANGCLDIKRMLKNEFPEIFENDVKFYTGDLIKAGTDYFKIINAGKNPNQLKGSTYILLLAKKNGSNFSSLIWDSRIEVYTEYLTIQDVKNMLGSISSREITIEY